MIPHSKPFLDRDDEIAVLDVLKSGHLVQGEKVAVFEKDVASFIGATDGVALNSGTAALHLSLVALGVGKGDEVVLPSYVCTALLNAVHYVCATPIIADIDPRTFNMDAQDARNKITKRTKAIILPHMFGLPADVDAFLSLGVPVIEDCALSIGSRFNGRMAGSFGVLSVFSFYATKMLATGEGGMVVSERGDLLDRIRDLRDYDETPEYAIRYNYKMTDMQAALGIRQLEKLPVFIRKRKAIADLYNRHLERPGILVPIEPPGSEHVYYRYILLVDQPDRFIHEMKERGVECRKPVFRPIHSYLGQKGFPSTENIWNRAVSIPLYPALREDESVLIAESTRSLLRGC